MLKAPRMEKWGKEKGREEKREGCHFNDDDIYFSVDYICVFVPFAEWLI